eukprot:TRINITY_DN3798_c0_g1_i6.p1 TRINITY_DN3798_c0_g1~~TRINITY_DN3798_c0_g1_i6.p1  ORF type:complete len:248 (-),score=18.15 TRINITY_DN3798_c0_g1_i6:2-745(-)
MPPILQALIDAYSWRVALQCLAVYVAIANTIACVLLRRRIWIKRKFEIMVLIKDRVFQLIFVMGALEAYSVLVPFYHIVAYAEDAGISHSLAAWILSTMGIASTMGRVILGWIGDQTSHLLMLKLSGLMLTVAMAIWPFLSSAGLLLAFGFTFGLFAGSFIAVLPVVLAQLFGVERMASVTGIVYSGFAIGNLFGPPVTGMFYDKQGTYAWGIWLAAAVLLLSFVLLLFVQTQNAVPSLNLPQKQHK